MVKPVFGQTKVIGLQKTSCYGACPVFTLDIYSNCKVNLKAEKFLELGDGIFTSKLSKSQLDELINVFQSNNYFELNELYQSKALDLPTTYFFFSDTSASKTIEVYGDWPEELILIDKHLMRLIGELNWKKRSK